MIFSHPEKPVITGQVQSSGQDAKVKKATGIPGSLSILHL